MAAPKKQVADRLNPNVSRTITPSTKSTVRLFCKDSTPLARNELLVRELPRTRLEKLLVARESLLYLVQLIVNDRSIVEVARSITVQAMHFVQGGKRFRVLIGQNECRRGFVPGLHRVGFDLRSRRELSGGV